MSFYNLNGIVVEIKGLEDTYFHDGLRIPNWPTQQAASQHVYHLNAAQDAGVVAAGVSLGAASGGIDVTPAGGAVGLNTGLAAGQAASNLATDANPVAGFLSRLANAHTWLRVAEAVVGIAFLIIGLNALLHNPAGKVAKVAAKVAPAAAL